MFAKKKLTAAALPHTSLYPQQQVIISLAQATVSYVPAGCPFGKKPWPASALIHIQNFPCGDHSRL